MEKYAKLDKVVRDWRKQDAAHKKVWKNVKKHFAVGIRDVQGNPANKKESGYANKALEKELEEVKDNTKFIVEQLLESQQVAMKLQEKLDELENKSNTSNTNNQNGNDKKTKVMTDQEKFTEFLKTMTFAKGGARRGQKVTNDMPNSE